MLQYRITKTSRCLLKRNGDFNNSMNTNPYESNTARKARYYSSAGWRNTSKSYKMQHPLCELCQVMDKVQSVDEIHHIVKFDDQDTDEKKQALLTDEDNLISLCKKCHHQIHNDFYKLSPQQQSHIKERIMKVKQKYDDKNVKLKYKGILSVKQQELDERDVYHIESVQLDHTLLDSMIKKQKNIKKTSLFQ